LCETRPPGLVPATPTRHQVETTTDNEVPVVQVHRQQERLSTDTSHYEEIVETEGPEEEQPTSEEDAEQEAVSEYAGLDPVAVAEHRARPPPVYQGLGRRNYTNM